MVEEKSVSAVGVVSVEKALWDALLVKFDAIKDRSQRARTSMEAGAFLHDVVADHAKGSSRHHSLANEFAGCLNGGTPTMVTAEMVNRHAQLHERSSPTKGENLVIETAGEVLGLPRVAGASPGAAARVRS